MDTALIASRYANALLQYACEQQEEDRVYADAHTLTETLCNGTPTTPGELEACIGGCSASMQRFITLVLRNRRAALLPQILHAYRTLYRKQKGITRAQLTTATENPELADKLMRLMQEQGLREVDFKTEVDPALIGGFIVQVEDKRLDVSVASQLKDIRNELEVKLRKNSQNG